MLIFVRIPNSELRWLTMYPCLIWGKMNCLRLSGSRLHRYRPYRSTFYTRYRSYRSTVYTRYRPYILQFIPDTGLTGHTLYQIQALQAILYTRYRSYRSYFIPDTGLTGRIDFFRMTGFKLLSLYKLCFLWFFIQMVLLGRREFGCLTEIDWSIMSTI